MNAVAEELTGWLLNKALQKPANEVFNVINEHTREEVEDPVTKVIEKGVIVGLANHTILVRKDGTEVAIDDSGAPIKGPNGNITGVVLVFRDITERKQTEAIMAQLASFPELNPSPVVEVDLTGQIRYANPSAQRLFPDLQERGLGHQWLSEFNLLRKSFESGQTRSYVRDVMVGERFYQQNAYYVEGDQSIRIYGIDITGRKRAEETVRQSEEQYRTLFNTLIEGFCIIEVLFDADDRPIDYRFLKINPAFEKQDGRNTLSRPNNALESVRSS